MGVTIFIEIFGRPKQRTKRSTIDGEFYTF